VFAFRCGCQQVRAAEAEKLTLDGILATLTADLIARGALTEAAAAGMSRLDLGMLLVKVH
jgi:hypothetical protein